MSEIIWVTGASSGIGRSLCLRLSQQGHRVIASARSRDSLNGLVAESKADNTQCSGSIEALVFDISARDTFADVTAQLTSMVPGLDRVVVNAGCCEYLDFGAETSPDWSAIERVVGVNLLGSVQTIAMALPLLKKSPLKSPHIIGIVSQVVFAPFSRAEAYGASKAAFAYFLESLRIDLSDQNIDVTAVFPGFVKTPMTDKNDFDMPFLQTTDTATDEIIKAFAKRPKVLIFPKRLYWLLKLSKLFPNWWARSVARKNL